MFSFSFDDDLKNCSIAFTLSYFVYICCLCLCVWRLKESQRNGKELKLNSTHICSFMRNIFWTSVSYFRFWILWILWHDVYLSFRIWISDYEHLINKMGVQNKESNAPECILNTIVCIVCIQCKEGYICTSLSLLNMF